MKRDCPIATPVRAQRAINLRTDLFNFLSPLAKTKENAPKITPATKNLKRGIETASPETRGLIELFDQHKSLLYWEQTYSKKDAFISEAMLADYGYAELIGTRGPFVSDRIRCGVGIYGANITYPMHWHLAEEIYIPLSGGARYTIGDKPETRHGPGEVVFVKSNTPHEFSTDDEALVVFYLWQAGDLRQVSEFSNA